MFKKLKGAALAEYAVILAVVLVGAVVALTLIGDNASSVFNAASDDVCGNVDDCGEDEPVPS